MKVKIKKKTAAKAGFTRGLPQGTNTAPKTPTVSAQSDQPDTGKTVLPAPKPKTFKNGSPYRDVKKGGDTYRVYADKSKGMKNLTPGGGKKKKATTPKDTTPEVDPLTARAEADVAPQFSQTERELIDKIGQGKAHQTTLDRLYAGYQLEKDQAKRDVGIASAAALAGMRQGAADSLAAAGAGTDQVNAQAATQQETTQADTGQHGTVDAQVRQALASAQQSNSALQDVSQLQGDANQAALDRLGVIGEGQKQIFKENTTAYVNQLGRDKMDNDAAKQAAIASRRGDLLDAQAAAVQQQIQNVLAEKSIASKDKKTQLDYQVALEGLRVKQRQIEASIDIAAGHDATSVLNNDNDNETTLTNGRNNRRTQLLVAKLGREGAQRENQRSREFDAEQKRLDRENAKLIAGMGGKSGGGKAATGRWQLPSGAVVTLTPASQEKWRSHSAAYRGAISSAGKLYERLATEGKTDEQAFKQVAKELRTKFNLPSSVARAAARVGQGFAPSGEYLEALKAWFPGGVIPGGGARKIG